MILTIRNLAVPNYLSKAKQRLASIGYVDVHSHMSAQIHTAWASALLVSTDRAMPEPRIVGRVTSELPTLFFICIKLFWLYSARESQIAYKIKWKLITGIKRTVILDGFPYSYLLFFFTYTIICHLSTTMISSTSLFLFQVFRISHSELKDFQTFYIPNMTIILM